MTSTIAEVGVAHALVIHILQQHGGGAVRAAAGHHGGEHIAEVNGSGQGQHIGDPHNIPDIWDPG